MLYEEYKKTFEQILELTEELETICKNNLIDDIDKVFMKRDKLFEKLSTPSDIDSQEKIDYIISLRDKISEKNEFIQKYMQVVRMELKKALLDVKQENRVIEAYKIPKGEIPSSIFDEKQ